MRLLNSVYVSEHQAVVSTTKGSLKISSAVGSTRVPLNGMDALIVFSRAQITTPAIAACVEHGVRVAALTPTGRVRFVVTPPTRGNVHLRTAQHRIADDDARRLQVAKDLVAGKLQNSRRVVGRWARDADEPVASALRGRAELITDRLGRVAAAPSDDHLRGIEGDAARAHFAAMASVLGDSAFPFVARRRRPPRDPVNATLGFCYGLVVTETTGAADAVGLDPQIGFLHRARSGRASLALDLAEELRPLVDRFVIGLIRRRQLALGDFTLTPGGAVYLSDDGRKKLLGAWEEHKQVAHHHPVVGRPVERWALPALQATLMARHVRGDLGRYPAFVVPQ